MNNIEQYVEDLEFDALLAEADNLGVYHEEVCWLDDQWPDEEDALRVNVKNALYEKLTKELERVRHEIRPRF